jgi:HD-GYP domain-containing protein (c-di-GMP phosphodiesterase class II)
MPALAPDPLQSVDTRSSLKALALALAQRDPYTGEHCDRVCRLAHALGERFDLDRERLTHLALAARFHDIGKIGVRDNVLLYPGRLDPTQRARMMAHPVLGQELFLATGREDASAVGKLIRHHHEAFDGSGYPDGLAGEAIPLEARILGVADGYDAMTSLRPYRKPMAAGAAMGVLEREQGGRIDPEVFRQLQAVLRRDPDC